MKYVVHFIPVFSRIGKLTGYDVAIGEVGSKQPTDDDLLTSLTVYAADSRELVRFDNMLRPSRDNHTGFSFIVKHPIDVINHIRSFPHRRTKEKLLLNNIKDYHLIHN